MRVGVKAKQKVLVIVANKFICSLFCQRYKTNIQIKRMFFRQLTRTIAVHAWAKHLFLFKPLGLLVNFHTNWTSTTGATFYKYAAMPTSRILHITLFALPKTKQIKRKRSEHSSSWRRRRHAFDGAIEVCSCEKLVASNVNKGPLAKDFNMTDHTFRRN